MVESSVVRSSASRGFRSAVPFSRWPNTLPSCKFLQFPKNSMLFLSFHTSVFPGVHYEGKARGLWTCIRPTSNARPSKACFPDPLHSFHFTRSVVSLYIKWRWFIPLKVYHKNYDYRKNSEGHKWYLINCVSFFLKNFAEVNRQESEYIYDGSGLSPLTKSKVGGEILLNSLLRTKAEERWPPVALYCLLT